MKRLMLAALLVVNCGHEQHTASAVARRFPWVEAIDKQGLVRIPVGDLGELPRLIDLWMKKRTEIERIEGRKLRPQFVYIRPDITRQVK